MFSFLLAAQQKTQNGLRVFKAGEKIVYPIRGASPGDLIVVRLWDIHGKEIWSDGFKIVHGDKDENLPHIVVIVPKVPPSTYRLVWFGDYAEEIVVEEN